jgi:hypothetical protein
VSVSLTSRAGHGVTVGAGIWKATIELLARRELLDAEKLELARYQACLPMTAQEAERIAEFLDGHLADAPAEQPSGADNGVPPAAWLARFRDFCRSSGGFLVE